MGFDCTPDFPVVIGVGLSDECPDVVVGRRLLPGVMVTDQHSLHEALIVGAMIPLEQCFDFIVLKFVAAVCVEKLEETSDPLFAAEGSALGQLLLIVRLL